MRDTLKAITENTPVSVSLILALFGILTTLIGAVMIPIASFSFIGWAIKR